MGGGTAAAMRSAAKVAGINVISGGVHGGGITSSVPTPAVARSASFKSAAATSIAQKMETASVQRSAWELDNWEFAGFEEAEAEPTRRVVFGPAPSLEEAKLATSELKNALQNDPFGVPSLSANSEYLGTKGSITCDLKAPVPTKCAMRAFTLFNESPAVQSVVASIASDANVWDAVLHNPALQEFLEKRRTVVDPYLEEYAADVKFQDPASPGKLAELFDSASATEKPEKSANGFLGVLKNFRVTLVEMANNAFAHLQHIFGVSLAENVADASDGSAKSILHDKTLMASFFGLVIMVIMVVVLKRG